MKSILDPAFRYRPSIATDLRATFARLRREQRKQASAQADRHAAADNLVSMQAGAARRR